MATEIKNKSEFVRGILRDIGALSENPPDGWRDKVEEALEKQGLKMHQVMIYQLRRKELEKSGDVTINKKKPGRKPGKTKGQKAILATPELSLDDILAARKVAEEFGGVGKLAAALSALDKINTTLLGK